MSGGAAGLREHALMDCEHDFVSEKRSGPFASTYKLVGREAGPDLRDDGDILLAQSARQRYR